MKRTIHNLIALTVFLGVATVAVAQVQTPQRSGPARGNNGQVGPRAKGGELGLISALPFEELSEEEAAALMFMREEEKLARDTYLALYDLWELPIFLNIASSEQRHMDSVGVLIEKYGLFDPALDQAGLFTDPGLQSLYDALAAAGAASPEDALLVGARIEELDISDLKQALATVVDNRDIQIVFQNLLNGSMNHLRAFLRLLSGSEVEFETEYLSPEELDEIINSTRERGRYGSRARSCSGECGSETGSGTGECRRRGGPNN